MKKIIFLVALFIIAAFLTTYSFSTNTASSGVKDSTKCKMKSGNCQMDKSKCSMGSGKCQMDKSKCNDAGGNKCTCADCPCSTGGECKCTDCKDCKNECCKKTECKKNTSGGMKSRTLDSLKVCPVSGETIDGAEGAPVTYTYVGKEYTFCCAGCVKKFKAEPMNYIKEDLMCPVTGEAASKDVSTVVDGVKYYFCCAGCISKFEKNPDKYLKK
jgi:YHS domain-containing protein